MTKYTGEEVIVMACSSCNIKKCEHCYISYEGDRQADDLYGLTEELAKKHTVYINGSEVLIEPEYFESYRNINQDWFLTNGIAIYKNPDILRYLQSKGINRVEMSYHFGIQDEISVMNNQMLDKVIEYIKQYGMTFKILTTISSANYNMVEDMCRRAYDMGASAIEFTNFLRQGNAINMSDENLLNEEQKKVFFEDLKKARSKTNKSNLTIDRSGTFGKDSNNKSNFKCPAGKDMVVITPDNNVYPCLFLAKPGNEIGQYIDGEIQINYEITHSGDNCIAEMYCNHGVKNLKKILQH